MKLIRLEPVTRENIKDIEGHCKQCLYWQTIGTNERTPGNQTEILKEKWLLRVRKAMRISGYILYVDSLPVGFVQLASPKYFPRLKEYTNATPHEDAIFLACFYIPQEENRGKGYGTQMLKTLLMKLKQMGFKAVETFARRSSDNNPAGPLDFYVRNGFRIAHDNTDFPLVRLEWA